MTSDGILLGDGGTVVKFGQEVPGINPATLRSDGVASAYGALAIVAHEEFWAETFSRAESSYGALCSLAAEAASAGAWSTWFADAMDTVKAAQRHKGSRAALAARAWMVLLRCTQSPLGGHDKDFFEGKRCRACGESLRWDTPSPLGIPT